jgi:hypothetical protein
MTNVARQNPSPLEVTMPIKLSHAGAASGRSRRIVLSLAVSAAA